MQKIDWMSLMLLIGRSINLLDVRFGRKYVPLLSDGEIHVGIHMYADSEIQDFFSVRQFGLLFAYSCFVSCGVVPVLRPVSRRLLGRGWF